MIKVPVTNCSVLLHGVCSVASICISLTVLSAAAHTGYVFCGTLFEELLVILCFSGYGVSISEIYCCAPMFADDLTLVASSPDDLSAMLSLVAQYAKLWLYLLNASKLVVGSNMAFGEAPNTRLRPRVLTNSQLVMFRIMSNAILAY